MVSFRISLLDHLKLKSFSKVECLLDGFKYTTWGAVCVCVYVCVERPLACLLWGFIFGNSQNLVTVSQIIQQWSQQNTWGNFLWQQKVFVRKYSQTPTTLFGVGSSWRLWELPFSTYGTRWSNHITQLWSWWHIALQAEHGQPDRWTCQLVGIGAIRGSQFPWLVPLGPSVPWVPPDHPEMLTGRPHTGGLRGGHSAPQDLSL